MTYQSKSYLKLFFKKRIIFYDNQKYDVLILDDGASKLDLSSICSSLTITKQIYFFCMLVAIIKKIIFLKFDKDKIIQQYYKELIKKFNCKILIAHDFKKSIFNLEVEGLTRIVYQFADHELINKEKLKKHIILHEDSNSKIDYYLIKHKIFEKNLDFIKTQFIETGSIKNNEKVVNNNKEEYDIMLISQFRPNIYNFFGVYNPKMMYNSDSAIWYLTNVISKYCSSNNKKLAIALASNREDKKKYNYKNLELKFFKSINDKFYTEDIDSYNLAEKSKIIVTTYSSLGLELLARGKKVFFLDPFHFLGGNYLNMFTSEKEGDHWLAGNDENKIFEKIDQLSNFSEEKWREIQKNSPLLIKFDPGNTRLKKIIQEIIF